MTIVPIVFAFDENLVLPAKICISSLLMNAEAETFYDIFILHADNVKIPGIEFRPLMDVYKNCRIQFRSIDINIGTKFEIRNITTACYYRLLIPDLIPEYDKIIYSDVDVIFRTDLSGIFTETDMGDYYIAGVNSLAHLLSATKHYYEKRLKLYSTSIIYSGNLIFNSGLMRRDNLTKQFIAQLDKKYTFQDMDIINIVCRGKIKYLSPSFCYTTYLNDYMLNRQNEIKDLFSEGEIAEAEKYGTIHYNGVKPWQSYCIHFDIWWEYYRKSAFYDKRYYYNFFYSKMEEYDRLSLRKRIKILLRYFVHGKKDLLDF
jgi:lipopolysaccharide biosynthesis glycosyltransferase